MMVQNGSLSTYNTVYKYDNKLKSVIKYYNIASCFDIETTSTYYNGDKVTCLYLWCLNIDGIITQGRTLEEFTSLISNVSKQNQLSVYKRLVVYVHNLPFEFQFIRKHFKWYNVFATDDRKVIKAITVQGIEFRDSYILSGYSLSNVSKICLNKTLEKEDYDYNLVRHSQTPLTDSEIHYNIRDTEIVVEYIKQQMEQYEDITKIPLTNTGRVRRHMRNVCLHTSKCHSKESQSKYSKLMKNSPLTLDVYSMLKHAFQGGFTHANANYTGEILENVNSVDISSSYPFALISEKYPSGEWELVQNKQEIKTLLNDDDTAIIFEVEFEEIQSKIMQEMYLSSSKCECSELIENNGRIYYACTCKTVITEIDYKIIQKCYKWKRLKIGKCYKSYKTYLPTKFVKGIIELYEDKTKLKGVKGQEIEYLNKKGMLNSIYGMCVTDIIRDNISYDDEWQVIPADTNKQLETYNNDKKRFTCYQWGVWCTAYARRNLWIMILNMGNDYIYSDTDSIKYNNVNKYEKLIEKYNEKVYNKLVDICKYHKISIDKIQPKDIKGRTHMIGIFEDEGQYEQFKTLGAKRYMYVDKNNELHITIAGLGKQTGKEYIEKHGGFELFNDNMYIPADSTGKQTHTYIDDERNFEIIDYLGIKNFENCKSSIHLEECEFTLSISKQYSSFLQKLKSGLLYQGDRKL